MKKFKCVPFAFVMILAMAMIALLGVGALLAQGEEPLRCYQNNFFVDVAKNPPGSVHQCQLIQYVVDVGNSGSPDGCNVTSTDVSFTQPALNGTATGSSAFLDTNANFPSDGSGDKTYLPGSYAILNYTVNVNPGVTAITVKAIGDGTLMAGFGSSAYVEKTIAFTVLWPDVEVTKTTDTEISKPGDTINYTIRVTNTGDCDLYLVSVDDSLMGDLTVASPYGTPFTVSPLASDAYEEHVYAYTVQPGDPDPLVNMVTVHYEDITAYDVNDTDIESVDLLHPDLAITKSGDTSARVGDVVTYSFFIQNTGDCTLDRSSVIDTLLGTITFDFPATLATGASANITKTRTVLGTDPDPLVNVVTAIYVVPVLGDQIIATDEHSVDIKPNPTIDITAPADIIGWELNPLEEQPLTQQGILTVTTTHAEDIDWIVMASDEDSQTSGHMTKWNNGYDLNAKLQTAMQVEGPAGTVILPDGGAVIAKTGTVTVAEYDITFKQTVLLTEAAVTSPDSYLIVVTFTGTIL